MYNNSLRLKKENIYKWFISNQIIIKFNNHTLISNMIILFNVICSSNISLITNVD